MSTRIRSVAAVTVAVTAVSVLAGCGSRTATDPDVVTESTATATAPMPAVETAGDTTDEVALHDGQVCPLGLPTGKRPGYGFGTSDPAPSAPEPSRADRAWVCGYVPQDNSDRGGEADRTLWVRTGSARPVPGRDLADIQDLLSGLAPAPATRMCTDDLGPRWMLVLSAGGDLTGVLVDDYGCGEVRMTAEPFVVVPGDDRDAPPQVVRGVLRAPEGLLQMLRRLGG